MKKLIFLGVFLILFGLIGVPVGLAAQGRSGSVDVLIQTEGEQSALVTYIQQQGGVVRFQYENVPAVAATVPLDNLAEIAAFSGVTYVEKDVLINLPIDAGERPLFHEVEDMNNVAVSPLDVTSLDLDALPAGYANFVYTGANTVWTETNFGADSVVAVVDTGTTPNVCLAHSVIGAPGFPDGYNATGDGYPATSTANHWHGTHVGGVVSSACALDFSADPTDPLWLSISAYLPWDIDNVPILGQAPLANIYPVKVFDVTGGSTPTSVILDGLDHILTLKQSGALDIDVVNMSLGGGSVFEAKDTFDSFVVKLHEANILVVSSAGNAGPIPNSVGSPASAWTSLNVGALDYAPSSRVLYEFLGYRVFGSAGQGLVMRPGAETRVSNFSSRGPLSDGRGGPDLAALGSWNFHAGPQNELRWAGGTSFASPTVAGAAALLNSYWEMSHADTNAFALRQSLMDSADPTVVGMPWRDYNDQGHGALDVPAALTMLQNRDWSTRLAQRTGALRANVLPRPRPNRVDTFTSGNITLNAGETVDFVFAINEFTSDVQVEIFEMQAPNNLAYAFWPNAIEINIQSAKRTSVPRPVEALWYPQVWGDFVTYHIGDGPWVEESVFGAFDIGYQPMEPGLMKVSLAGDYSNESPVSFKVRITREGFRQPPQNMIAISKLQMNDAFLVPVEIPAGVTTATFDAVWNRDWDSFPTSDIDMVVYDSAFNLVSLMGATLNAPERVVLNNPAAGTYYVYIQGYEMYRTDTVKLFLTLD